jgi:hypothetical protein
MAEGPLRHVPSLLSRLGVGEAEMNPFEDTGCDHIIGGVRETVIGTRLLDRHRVGGRHNESHFVRPKKERERAGRRASDVVGARSVVGIVRGVDQRLPVWISNRPRVGVVITESNGGYRPPKIVGDLGVPRGDYGIGHRQIDQGEEPRAVSNVVHTRCGKFPNYVSFLRSLSSTKASFVGLDLLVISESGRHRDIRLAGSATYIHCH